MCTYFCCFTDKYKEKVDIITFLQHSVIWYYFSYLTEKLFFSLSPKYMKVCNVSNKHCNSPNIPESSRQAFKSFFVSIFAFLQVFLSCQNMACDHLFVYCCTYWNVNLLDKLIGLSHVNLIDLDQVGRQANRLIIVARYTLLTATNCAIKIRAVAAVLGWTRSC